MSYGPALVHRPQVGDRPFYLMDHTLVPPQISLTVNSTLLVTLRYPTQIQYYLEWNPQPSVYTITNTTTLLQTTIPVELQSPITATTEAGSNMNTGATAASS